MSTLMVTTAPRLEDRPRLHLDDDDAVDEDACVGKSLGAAVSNDASSAPTSPTMSTRTDSPLSLASHSGSPHHHFLSQEEEALQVASRFGDLERKRKELVQKRVNLECKLFESSESITTYVDGFDPRSSGRGKYSWSDGKSVTGQWFEGQLNGRCFFQWPSGETYDGDVKNGKKHGRGVHTWADGKIYKGQYQNGFEHGFGTLTQADGVCRYRGQFVYGKRHGTGTQVWPERTYEGEWKDNAVCGRGRLSWNSGSRYEGEFFQGKYHGQGVFVDKWGHKYVGSWVHGRKEGFGRETWPHNEQSYVGSYQNGRRSGFGRLDLADESYYVGGWCNGERSGYGIQMGVHGEVVECGVWENDHPMQRRIGKPTTHDEHVTKQSLLEPVETSQEKRITRDDLVFFMWKRQLDPRRSSAFRKLYCDDSGL